MWVLSSCLRGGVVLILIWPIWYHMLLYICRRQYTLPSRKKCNHAIGVAGIGWTKDFRNKFNDLDDSFNKDRSSWGVTFSNALMNVFLERQCVVKANPTRPNARPASYELIWDLLTLFAGMLCKIVCSNLEWYEVISTAHCIFPKANIAKL